MAFFELGRVYTLGWEEPIVWFGLAWLNVLAAWYVLVTKDNRPKSAVVAALMVPLPAVVITVYVIEWGWFQAPLSNLPSEALNNLSREMHWRSFFLLEWIASNLCMAIRTLAT